MSAGPIPHGPPSSVTTRGVGSFTYASVDLNVLITGRLLNGGELKEGAQFELAENGVVIQHPALTRVTKTSQAQTLRSLNTNQPIFTLPTPDPSAPAPSPSDRPIISLHLPLLTFAQAKPLQQSPLYSSTFKILLDGPGFEPPRFDPHKVPGTPAFGPQGVNSPTIQRALLSPLLSPVRRASVATPGQGGATGSADAVPQLPLLARGRSGSIAGNGRDPSPPRPKGLEALLPPAATAPSLSAVALEEISGDSKRAADEIMAIRRAHEAHVRRIKSEQDVLEARAAYVNGLPIPTENGGVIVHGFGKDSASHSHLASVTLPAASAVRRASASRERSADRSRSHDHSPLGQAQSRDSPDASRGRTAGTQSQSQAQQDEAASRKVVADDVDEERGRSRSRQRAGRVSSASRQRAQQAVAAAVEKVVGERSRSPLPPPGPGDASPSLMRSPKDKPRAGDSISATLEEDVEEEDGPVATLIPEEKAASVGAGQGVAGFASAGASFVPSSHVLVSVPEEELTIDSPAQEPTDRGHAHEENRASDSETSLEHEDPFEMDEDLDVDDLTLPSAVDSAPMPDFDSVPASPVVKPSQGPAQSFRGPSSMRQSNLSSSYAALLSSSLASRPRPSMPGSPSYGFKSPPVLPALSPFSATPSSPASSRHGNETTPAIDAKVELSYLPQPDHKVTQESARQIRDLQALDAPSHRKPVPRRTSSRKSQGYYSQDEEDDHDDDDDNNNRSDGAPSPQVRPTEYAVGSVPISMGFRRPGGSSNFAPGGDDPRAGPATVSAARSYLPEGFVAKPKTGKRVSIVDPTGLPPPAQGPSGFAAETMQVEPVALGARVAPAARANGAGVASSLAQSLRNPPANSSSMAGRLAAEEEEYEVGEGEDDDPNDRETGFRPPHEWRDASRSDEELLSRSVPRD